MLLHMWPAPGQSQEQGQRARGSQNYVTDKLCDLFRSCLSTGLKVGAENRAKGQVRGAVWHLECPGVRDQEASRRVSLGIVGR